MYVKSHGYLECNFKTFTASNNESISKVSQQFSLELYLEKRGNKYMLFSVRSKNKIH